ncbi:MAG: QsdR family transcriptional regulator [Myxococcales bacterium]
MANRSKKTTHAARREPAPGRPRRQDPEPAQPERPRLASVPSPEASEATPLARTLRNQRRSARVTPLDLFALSRSKWLAGERLDIGRLAKELGVGRATLFRWVGSREQLYGEILSASYVQEMERARRKIEGKGAEGVAAVARHVMLRLVQFEPLRRFIAQDPEFAIRVLTSNSSPVQRRCIDIHRVWLGELEAAGEIEPELDVDTLSYVIVRIGEAFLYGDVPAERESGVDKAAAAIRILVSAPRRR